MRWEDSSERQPGERLAEPNRLHIEGQALRIVLRKDARGNWSAHYGLGMFDSMLEAKTAKEAQHEAIELVQTKLERMLSELHQIKAVTT